MQAVTQLKVWKEGSIVSVDDTTGVIGGKLTEDFTWVTNDGDDEYDIEASRSNPIYIVARLSGGSMPYEEDDLSEGSFDEDEKDPKELANKGESAAIYDQLDDPMNLNEFEQLLNVPGVDDPEVGFSSLPNGWTRATVLQAWASLGGTWTSCRSDMVGEISRPENFCAAMKDEVLQTENWRNRY